MGTIHISAKDAAREFSALIERVRAGAEVVIEDGTLPVAIIHTPLPGRRSVSERIALAKRHEEESGEAPVLDADFAADVERVLSNRKPWTPPAWD